MSFKKHIPNLFTLLNLLSGTIAVYFAANGLLVLAAYFVFLGIFFDFFDGFAARLLQVQGELGKQLDSLADVITSGVVPGMVMFQLLFQSLHGSFWTNFTIAEINDNSLEFLTIPFVISSLGFLIPLAAGFRLAKFNIDVRQTNSFIGLPTPAAAIVVLSFPLIIAFSEFDFAKNLLSNTWFLIGVTGILCLVMNTEVELFALKFKDYSLKNNKSKFVFLIVSLLLLVGFQFIAIPVVILLYVVMSLFFKDKVHSQN